MVRSRFPEDDDGKHPERGSLVAQAVGILVERVEEQFDDGVDNLSRADRLSRPAQYERNDGYLEWQDANRLARKLTVEEIINRVHRLENCREEFEQRFETTDPTGVSVFEHDGHDAIHERMDAISEWQSLNRDIRLYELARQLSQNDGHLLPA